MLNSCSICWENQFFGFIYPGRVCWAHIFFYSKHLPLYLFTSIQLHTLIKLYIHFSSWPYDSNSPFVNKVCFPSLQGATSTHKHWITVTHFPNSYFSHLWSASLALKLLPPWMSQCVKRKWLLISNIKSTWNKCMALTFPPSLRGSFCCIASMSEKVQAAWLLLVVNLSLSYWRERNRTLLPAPLFHF